jgi:purine-binding chemotaxis protein CheW
MSSKTAIQTQQRSIHDDDAANAAGPMADFVTMFVAGQLFGIPVLQVQDILAHAKITRVPLAPPEIAGSLNLRGRIVTAIDLRTRLGMPPAPSEQRAGMNIVVHHNNELYSLIVDKVGDVLSLAENAFEPNPPTLDSTWRSVSKGIYRLEGQLMVVIDAQALLG